MDWNAPGVVDQLRQMWRDGKTTAEIGRALGCSKNCVISKRRRLPDLDDRPNPIGIGTPKPKLIAISGRRGYTPEDRKAIKADLDAGMTVRWVAHKHHRNANALQRYARKKGWLKKKPEAYAKAVPLESRPAHVPPERPQAPTTLIGPKPPRGVRCQYIEGEPSYRRIMDGTLFCSCRAVMGSYCERHYRICYVSNTALSEKRISSSAADLKRDRLIPIDDMVPPRGIDVAVGLKAFWSVPPSWKS